MVTQTGLSERPPKSKTPAKKSREINITEFLSYQFWKNDIPVQLKPWNIGESKEPLHKRMEQLRLAASSGQDSAVHLHLKLSRHSTGDSQVVS